MPREHSMFFGADLRKSTKPPLVKAEIIDAMSLFYTLLDGRKSIIEKFTLGC